MGKVPSKPQVQTETYPNGMLRSVTHTLEGQYHGKCEWWDRDMIPERICHFDRGVKHGLEMVQITSSIYLKCEWQYGKKQGPHFQYQSEKIMHVRNYDNDLSHGLQMFNCTANHDVIVSCELTFYSYFNRGIEVDEKQYRDLIRKKARELDTILLAKKIDFPSGLSLLVASYAEF